MFSSGRSYCCARCLRDRVRAVIPPLRALPDVVGHRVMQRQDVAFSVVDERLVSLFSGVALGGNVEVAPSGVQTVVVLAFFPILRWHPRLYARVGHLLDDLPPSSDKLSQRPASCRGQWWPRGTEAGRRASSTTAWWWQFGHLGRPDQRGAGCRQRRARPRRRQPVSAAPAPGKGNRADRARDGADNITALPSADRPRWLK